MSAFSVTAIVAVAILVYGAYGYVRVQRAVCIGTDTVAQSKRFTLEDPTRPRTLLVLGDSTAASVGSPAALSVPGRLAKYLNASVENYAVSGAVTADLPRQAAQAQREHYDLIEIQIGANDVIHPRSLAAARDALDTSLKDLRTKSDRIVVLTAGDIGTAPLFFWPLNWIVSYRTHILRDYFMAVCAAHNAVYVDIFSAPDVFAGNEARYHAPDGLHLNGEGYGYWFELVKKSLAQWPELSNTN